MSKPLSELVLEFISEQDVNDLSKKTYRRAIDRFVKWVVVSSLNFWKLKKKDIISYKSSLISDDLSVYTIDLYLTVIRKFYSWLDDSGLYENIAAGIRSPRRERKFKKGYLSVDQVNKLLTSIDKSTIIGKRDYAIISLMIGVGLRRVEVCRMSVGDVISDGGNVLIRIQRKGHSEKDSEICISDEILQAIHDYLVERDDLAEDTPLFVTHAKGYKASRLSPGVVSRMVKERLINIGISDRKFTCHSLRHTAAILALKAGASIYEVQQMLGHTDIKTTTIYLRAIDEETRVNNRAVKLLGEVLSKRTNDTENGKKRLFV